MWTREIGRDEFAAHFDKLSFVLSTGTESQCKSRVFQDNEGNWQVIVFPTCISRSGVNSEKDYIELTECGLRLYKRLLTAPTFRYSLAGIEVDGFSRFSELVNLVWTGSFGQKSVFHHPGLFLRQDVWEHIGKPVGLWKFRPGFGWNSYQGEAFRFHGKKHLLELWKSVVTIHNPNAKHNEFQLFVPE